MLKQNSTQRTPEYYDSCEYTAIKSIENSLELYKDPRAAKQEVKRNINTTLRRFQDYAILERTDIVRYYVDTSSEDTTVEHVIPVTMIVDMLLNNEISIREALYSDIVLLSKSNNKLLREAGLTKKHNNPQIPFSRYTDAGIDITTIKDPEGNFLTN